MTTYNGFTDNFDGDTLSPAWSAANASVGSTRTVSDGALTIFAPHGSGGYEGVLRALPAAPWRETIRVSGVLGADNDAFGVLLRDSSNGKMMTNIVVQIGTALKAGCSTFSSFSTFDTLLSWYPDSEAVATDVLFRFWSDDAVTFNAQISIDEGVTWFGPAGAGDFLHYSNVSFHPDEIILAVAPNGSDVTATFDFISAAESFTAQEIFVPGPRDHVALGLDRLLEQFRGELHPIIQGLAAAPLDLVNRLEGVVWTLLTQCDLTNAQGAWLDEWGEIFDIERNAGDDDTYRTMVQAQIYALRSSGTVEDIYRVISKIQPGWVGGIDDMSLDPATFRLSITSPILDDGAAELLRAFLWLSRAAGVQGRLYSWPSPSAQLFMFRSSAGAPVADSAHGFNAGKFAREVIA